MNLLLREQSRYADFRCGTANRIAEVRALSIFLERQYLRQHRINSNSQQGVYKGNHAMDQSNHYYIHYMHYTTLVP